jgi:PAB1-binding protein PBP1
MRLSSTSRENQCEDVRAFSSQFRHTPLNVTTSLDESKTAKKKPVQQNVALYSTSSSNSKQQQDTLESVRRSLNGIAAAAAKDASASEASPLQEPPGFQPDFFNVLFLF